MIKAGDIYFRDGQQYQVKYAGVIFGKATVGLQHIESGKIESYDPTDINRCFTSGDSIVKNLEKCND